MANIYKLNYTASQVNEAIGNALSAVQPNQPVDFTDGIQKNGVDVLNANEISNPNLLINGDFRINQRGQTTYTGIGYAIDRWGGGGSAPQMSVETNGNITLTNTTSNNAYYKQVSENSTFLAGQTVTMSASLASISSGEAIISIYTTTNSSPSGWTILATKSISQSGIYSVTAAIPNGITFVSFDIGVMGTNSTGGANSVATYEWAKVELGSVATAFSPRPYAEELALCQRYYFNMYNNGAGTVQDIGCGVVYSTTLAYITIPLPTTMRTLPSLSFFNASNFMLFTNGQSVSITDGVIYSYSPNCLVLRITSSGLTVGTSCWLRLVNLTNNNQLAFDAEM